MTAEASVPLSLVPAADVRGERRAPHNQEVEQALLGALLLNNAAFEKVSDVLRPEYFFTPAHGRIYQAIATFLERGQEANAITLKNYFDKDAELAHLGGAQYLADLAGGVISTANAADYARAVHDLHLRRALIALGTDVADNAYVHRIEDTAHDQIEAAERRLFDLATTGDDGRGFIAFRDSLTRAIQHAELAYQREGMITGVTTGLADINKKLGGLQKSDLVVLAGRPSMGKTALATNIAFSAARAYLEHHGKDGAVVGFFSLEMSAEQLATRILADLSGVPSDRIRRGELRDTDFHTFVEASRTLAQVPLFIDDTPALTISAVRTRARRLQRQHKLGLLVVDYLQLLQGSARAGTDNRVQEISEITRGLKAIAKELNIPVLALSQLSRAVEGRDNKRPQLSDLRESGSIEQDADVVMFVYRDEYYLERDEPKREAGETDDKYNQRYADWQRRMDDCHNIAECIIAKQRHGPIGTVRLHFDGERTRFSNLEQTHESGGR